MIKKFQVIVICICLFMLVVISASFAYEIYYPKGSDPLVKGESFAGETKYPTSDPVLQKFGVNFWLYNDGSGEINLNLRFLPSQKIRTSPPVVSPDLNHIVYTKIFNYATFNEFVSKCYHLPTGSSYSYDENSEDVKQLYKDNYTVRKNHNSSYEILSLASPSMPKNLFKTLTVIDWSYDSTRVLIKEHFGLMTKGIFGTKLWVYDVRDDVIYEVKSFRNAIINYYMKDKSLDLNRHVWDIEILGWEKLSNRTVIVNAYLYKSKGKKVFLGVWSGDIFSKKTQLLSLEDEDYDVGRYGLIPGQF